MRCKRWFEVTEIVPRRLREVETRWAELTVDEVVERRTTVRLRTLAGRSVTESQAGVNDASFQAGKLNLAPESRSDRGGFLRLFGGGDNAKRHAL